MAERMIRPGEKYRHFKNKLYQIITLAEHSETAEKMVVYQALYGDFNVYVRPYDMFISQVDHEKYPQASQRYRFELVEEFLQANDCEQEEQDQEPGVHPDFLQFLETDDYNVRMECLKRLKPVITQEELNSIYLVLDMKQEEGDIASRVEAVRRFLTMQNHFDGGRLR